MRVMVGELPRPVHKTHLELSLSLLQKAAAGGGGPAALYDELGTALELLGKIPAAIAAYTEAITRSKEARLLVKRAWAHEKVEDFDRAGADFTAAIQLSPDYAEAHAGLGYIQACRGKIGGAASRPAAEAVLRGGGDYLLLHNVACVYGKLSEKVAALDKARAREYQDLALAYLEREVELWKRDRTGGDPRLLIQEDPAFPPSLRQRPEFKRLFEQDR
jgi:tetratricopeptide (TPR) repeat protein